MELAEGKGQKLGSVLLHDAQSQLKWNKNIPLVVEKGSSFPKEHSDITCSVFLILFEK